MKWPDKHTLLRAGKTGAAVNHRSTGGSTRRYCRGDSEIGYPSCSARGGNTGTGACYPCRYEKSDWPFYTGEL